MSKQTDTTLLRHTLNRLGHSMEDIDSVFKDHKGTLNFQTAKQKLQELKNRKKYEYILTDEDIKPSISTSSAMIVISSDSEESSDEEMDTDQSTSNSTMQNAKYELEARKAALQNKPSGGLQQKQTTDWSQMRTVHDLHGMANIAKTEPAALSPMRKKMMFAAAEETDKNMGDFVPENLAYLDMPKQNDLQMWFEKNYQPKFDGVVLKEDMFSHFCKHFKTSSYEELKMLFLKNIQHIISRPKYADVEYLHDQFFDGLEKVENGSPDPRNVTDQLQKILKIDRNLPKRTENEFAKPASPKSAETLKSLKPRIHTNEAKPEDFQKQSEKRSAVIDMPSQNDLQEWFGKNYQEKLDGVVLNEDIFSHFCSHFKTPSYEELQTLFFEKIEKLIRVAKYALVEYHKDQYFEGLEKVEAKNPNPEKVTDQLQKLLHGNKLVLQKNADDLLKPAVSKLFMQPDAEKVKPAAMVKEKVPEPAPRKIQKVPSPKTKKRNNMQSPTLPGTSSTYQIPHFAHDPSKQPRFSSKTKVEKNSLPNEQKLVHLPSTGVEMTVTNAGQRRHLSPSRPFQKQNHMDEERTINVQLLSTKQLLNLSQTDGDFNLRPVVIDGSNVACSHGNGMTFSCRGIALCVRYFWLRGHRDITCFVPNYRKAPGGQPPIKDRDVLFDLEEKNICKFTPSRKVNGRMLVSYDDRFVLDLALSNDGVVVSNDQYRDLIAEKPGFNQVIANSLLQYVFVKDLFMPAQDPLGRNGPDLDQFLSFTHRAPKNRTVRNHRIGTDNFSGIGSRMPENVVGEQFDVQALAQAGVSNAVHANMRLQENFKENFQKKEISGKKPPNQLRQKVADIPQSKNKPKQAKNPQREIKKAKVKEKPEKLAPKQNKPNKPPTTEEQLVSLFPESVDKIKRLVKEYPAIDDVNWFANLLLMTAD